MAMHQSISWDAVSSVSTAIASLVAAGTILATVIIYRRRSRAEASAQIRQDMRSFSIAVGRVARLLEEGNAIVSAAWKSATIASNFTNGDTNTVRRLLTSQSFILSITTTGWGESPEVTEMRSNLTGMLDMSRHFSGDLGILSETGGLLDKIIRDMAATYYRVLNTRELRDEFIQNTSDLDGQEFFAQLAQHLHNTTADYFHYRYERPVEVIDKLAVKFTEAISGLSDREILDRSRRKFSLPVNHTSTDAIRVMLDDLNGTLDPSTIILMLNELETSLEPETAVSRATREAVAR
ncbi:hypothetical protein ABZ725_20745 [Streptomyces sp. NPDC006872]|uniref:hypothetical protein n=1 Tax=Streptomyces sp. NPDC006872 TaxID=3155720 RepID=UPI0033C0E299